MRGRRGPVQPSFHPNRNKDQQRTANWIRPLIFWVLSNGDEGTLRLLDAVPFISSVVSKVGAASKSIIVLEIVWLELEFRTTEWIEPAIGESEIYKELGLGKEYVSTGSSISRKKIMS